MIPANPWPPTAAHWLYDEIMRHIQPDLMLERIPLLEKKYAGETPEQHDERMQAYERAFAAYEHVYGGVEHVVAEETHRLKNEARRDALGRESQERGEALHIVEDQFRSLGDA